jgi:hypothetical protein
MCVYWRQHIEMLPRGARNWTVNELGVRAAETAISALRESGVDGMPVKGLVLAREVYDPAERSISDVDLIIPRRSFSTALRVARAAGWQLVWDARVVGSVNFVVDDFPIDVKCTFGPAGVSAIGVPAIFRRAALSEHPLGFAHWRIERHDHALLLAMDAFKDGLGGGKPWAREDLVRIASSSEFLPESLIERAMTARLQTMLAIVAGWVLSSGPSPAWAAVQKHLASVRLRSDYLARYQRLLRARPTSIWHRRYASALTRMVSDSVQHRVLAITLGALGTAKYVVRHGRLRVNLWDDIHRKSQR